MLTPATPSPALPRRRVLRAGAALALAPWAAAPRAQPRPPITDMHSHYGMLSRPMASSGMAEQMRDNGVAIVAWKLIADSRWIRAGASGIEQFREPAAGALASHFQAQLDRMKAYLAASGLRAVLGPADVDACLAGEPGIVLASEGADFLEGQVDRLAAAREQGLRHLQLVHYIRTPVGDFQTVKPVHDGLSPMGKALVEACNAQRILVDLAHCSSDTVEQAMAIAKQPLVWSHGWVDRSGGHWLDRFGFLQRRLSLALARKIAATGGVIGLWGFGLSQPGPAWGGGWSAGRRDVAGYARELVRLVDQLGAEHVALGTDIEGVGENWTVNDYADVRRVLEQLQALGMPAGTIERVAGGNYARVLKAVL